MTKTYLENLKALFADRAGMTPEKLQTFMGQTMEYLVGLRLKMVSKNPAEQEEAMKAALELKDVLADQMADLVEIMGIDPSQFSESQLMDQMNPKDREMMLRAKDQFSELKDSLTQKKKRPKKRNLINIVG